MSRRALHPSQLDLLNIIEQLGFGRIGGIRIRDGKPWFGQMPEIVQEVKLDSDPEPRNKQCNDDYALKSEFERLFYQLNRLRDGIVDVEVRHSLPFKLAVSRGREELLA